MTLKQFKALRPCPSGHDYALKFPSIKEAWLNCTNIRDMLWLANKATKRIDLIVIFAEECAGRAFTYATTAATYSAYAAYAAYAADAAAAAYTADAAAAAANAANTAYTAAEREIQRERIYELFTNLIFPE